MMYILGFGAAFLFLRYAVRRGTLQLTQVQIEKTLVYSIIGMLLGARLTYILLYNPAHYLANPLDILTVWYGGLSFHGGILGVSLALLIFARRQGIPFLNLTDHGAVITPLGIGLGRIGNFINGELWGRVSDVPWAMVFPTGGPLPRHPSQLYQSVLEGWLLFAFLFICYKRGPWKHGTLSALFFLGYAILRFIGEYFREPDKQLGYLFDAISMGQLLCIVLGFAGVILMVYAQTSPAKPRGRSTRKGRYSEA
jgi:phosphatidylglycerol:prolipoprotein diacylglycerol transferase